MLLASVASVVCGLLPLEDDMQHIAMPDSALVTAIMKPNEEPLTPEQSPPEKMQSASEVQNRRRRRLSHSDPSSSSLVKTITSFIDWEKIDYDLDAELRRVVLNEPVTSTKLGAVTLKTTADYSDPVNLEFLGGFVQTLACQPADETSIAFDMTHAEV